MTKSTAAASSLLALACSLTLSAHAQDSSKQTGSETLEEVLITATRYFRPVLSASAAKMDLQIVDTPQAISVINTDVLSTFNITNVSQLSKFSAGLTNLSDNIGERPNFVSRGYSLDLFDGYKLNGISYIPDQNIDPIALSRIEVLKGPTGVTYGRNSYGGAINFIVKTPFEDVGNFVQFGSGQRGFTRAAADTTIAIQEGVLALRVPVAYETRDAQATPDLKSVTVAPSIAWKPNEDFTATLATLYQNIDSHISYGLAPLTPEVATQGPEDFNPCFIFTCSNPPEHLRSREFTPDWDFAKSESVNTFLMLDYALSDRLRLTVNGSHSNGRFDSEQLYVFGPLAADDTANFYFDRPHFRTRGWSAETNLTGSFDLWGGSHQFYFGVDYRKYRRDEERVDFTNVFYALIDLDEITSHNSMQDYLNDHGLQRPNFIVGGTAETNRTYKGVGAQVLFDLPASFKMLLGARFEDAELDFDWTTLSGPDQAEDFNISSSEIIPRASLIYELAPGANLYASYTEGYVPQSGQVRRGGQIDPETGKQYEFGAKAEFFDKKLLATLAVYYLDRSGVAIGDPDNLPGESFVIGGLEQTNKGVELELIGQLLPGLSVAAAASVIDAKMGDGSRFDGTWLAGVPERTLSAYLTYETRPGQAGNWTFSGGAAHTGMQFGGTGEIWRMPSYTVVDAAIGWQATDAVRIKLIGSNLSDEVYTTTIGSANLLTQFGEPRTFKVMADFHF